MGGKHYSKGGGGKHPGKKDAHEALDRETVYTTIQMELRLNMEQLAAEPIDDTERKVRLVAGILRTTISALGEANRDSGPLVKEVRREALHRLIKKTSEFEESEHTSDTINLTIKIALCVLSDTYTVFGPSFTSIRESLVQLVLEQIDGFEKKDPLQQEKEELTRMEERAKKVQEREAMERREKTKAEKKNRKKNRKKNKKKSKQAQLTNENDKLNDELGDERVPPQLTPGGRRQVHNPESQDEGAISSSDHGDSPESPDPSVRNGNVQSTASRSPVNSTSSSSDNKVISRIMTEELWSQFSRIYDRGSKK